MSQKVVEFYLATLKEYSQKLNKSKLTVLMQVGEFFEIYGLIYPDGTREGNVWEFCDDVNLKVAAKPQVVYDRPEIQVFMGGVGESYVNPYIQKAVDRFGWTIVIFDQQRIGNSAKFERREASIISPGVNINSDNFSNISMVIYMEQIRNYYTNTSSTSRPHTTTINKSSMQIQIGVAFIDCLTGDNGVMSVNNTAAGDLSIALDELLKLLTIKNPNELNIYLENISAEQMLDEDLVNSLHLFNYNYKIHRASASTPGIEEKYHKLPYQNALLEKVYIRHRGLLDITQQLGIDGGEHIFSRIALILLIEFILKHDKTILDKLEMPEVLVSSDKYLMLANNALEQLDVLDNLRAEYKKFNNRLTLLDLLDSTKTPLGKTLLRQRLSIPITESHILEGRYAQIGELLVLHRDYVAKTTDKYGSPLHQIRSKLAPIRNIENYLRKIITSKIQPCELIAYLESLESSQELDEYIKQQTQYQPHRFNSIKELYPSPAASTEFHKVIELLKTSLNTANLRAAVWSGVESNPFQKGISPTLDALQTEIDDDRGFLDNLILALSTVIEPKWSPATGKQLIYTGENASKGIHIFTNTTRKEALEAFFAKKDAQLKVGNYKITHRDIKFLKMKESKWEIEIPYLKTSNGTLKANIDRMGKAAKAEMNKWLAEKIISQVSVLDALGTYARFIAEIDVLQSNTLAAVENGYSRPELDSTSGNSYLKAGLIRHPIIEHIMQTAAYVPNDISLGAGVGDGILLFGVNAVGKSSLMKSLGLAVIMAQAGMYVAASNFTYRPFKYLFTRILGNDNLYAGLSSFEVEMKEFKVILKYSNADSLLLCDEVCRGTVMEDGTALVASALEILSRRKVKFLSATHLHNLTAMDCIKKLDNVRFYHLLVEQDKINPAKLIYTRKLQPGSGPSSYGILVAQSMNMDAEFITRAQEIRTMIGNTVISTSTMGTDATSTATIGASKYNKDKVIAICEVCGGEKATDVHHINQQCDADSVDLLDTLDAGIFNKNKLWNLVALCKRCHQAVHSAPSQLTIKGYIPTSSGVELGFVWVGLDDLSRRPSEHVLHQEQTMQQKQLLQKENEMILEQEYVNEPNIGKKKVKPIIAGGNRQLDITPEMRKQILEMKSKNATPKKIQFDMKRYWNLEITQQHIREIV
jgi:DNA mismatch repair protein MutS